MEEEKIHKVEFSGEVHDAVVGISIFRIGPSGKKEVLIVAQKPEGPYYPLGGKWRDGETMQECARRELKEELGIEYDGEFGMHGVGPDSYTIKGKKLAIWNLTLMVGPDFTINPRIQEGDPIRHFKWTSEPLDENLTLQARYVWAQQMPHTTLPKSGE